MSSSYPHRNTADRHAFPSAKWPGEPVPIIPPSNDHRPLQDRAPTTTRTRNPHNIILPKKNQRIGNTTSRSTLVQKGSSMTSGPSPKKRKLENHPPPANLKGMNKDAPLVVLDDEDVGPDELNLRSDSPNMRPSKYAFSGLKSSSKVYTVIDDGETTKEIASTYSSDPIVQYSPDHREMRNGFVSRRIHQYENNDTHPEVEIPKLNLLVEAHKLKESNKRRMKGKSKGNVIPLKPVSMTRTQPEKQPDKIPVHSFYADAKLWEGTPHQQLWMYTRNRRLLIEENSKKLIDERIDVYSMLLAKPREAEISSTPAIQFVPTNGSEIITIRLDTTHPQWNKGSYNRFVETVTNHFVKIQTMRPEQTARLWEMAQQNANETHNPKVSAIGPKGLNDLQSKPRQTNTDLPLSIHTTKTSLKRKADVDLLDTQAEPPSHPLGFKTGSSRPNAFSTERNLRSRKKIFLDTEPVPSAPTNPDEVVLSYPAGLPGAVNITNIDLERLNPGAFLNDTLIEFGLKVWLRDLEIFNPELFDQIHVFSSFFYKKFNTTKDLELAYESVRKWTNKFDIFRKRYIIVPINEHLHWYLAIIYEPEHVIQDPPIVINKSPPRPRTRLSTAHAISEIDCNSSRTNHPLEPLETQMEDIDQRSEVEVERDLEDFQNSCTIEDCVPPHPESHSEIYESLEDDALASPNHPKIIKDGSTTNQRSTPPISSEGRRPMDAVDPKRFYQSQRQNGKKKVGNRAKSPRMDSDLNERDVIEVIDNIPKTYIFTFDSLGSRHPQAIKRLAAYLRLEAKDKKGVNARGIIEGKNALVPFQTNLCDCGIYLLHFARTFMSDPRQFANIILAPRSKSTGDAERKVIWHVDKDFEPEGRQQIRLRIEDLSKEWKKLRGGTQKQPGEVTKEDDESEGEVELVESDTDKHSKVTRKTTGPASRVRG